MKQEDTQNLQKHKLPIGDFFKEMAQKHKVDINDLNLHITGGTLYVQEYTPNSYSEFRLLETIDLH